MIQDLNIIHNKIDSENLHQWLAMLNGHVIGHVYARVESDFEAIKLLDAHVKTEHRGQGIYTALWEARTSFFADKGKYKGWRLYAWCKETSINQFIKNDFTKGETVTYVEREL